jgi:adenylosuccinate synthase
VLPGWEEPLDRVETLDDLPESARRYIDVVEREVGVDVSLIGTGRDRERVIAPRELEALLS